MLPEGRRQVKFENGDTEDLHVDDIQECHPAPMFKRTLRAGDHIEYIHNHVVNGPEVVDGKVLQIRESAFTTSSRPQVVTSRSALHPGEKFRIIRSEHSDAPRTGKWTSFQRVNLEEGSVDREETLEEREEMQMQNVTSQGFQMLGALGLVATKVSNALRREGRDERASTQARTSYQLGVESERLTESQGMQTRSRTKSMKN